jgi:hypothetical protein
MHRFHTLRAGGVDLPTPEQAGPLAEIAALNKAAHEDKTTQGQATQACHPNWWPVIATVAITLQCLAAFFFNIRNNYYISDDINTIELMHQSSFLSFISTTVDIHCVPLHRAVNWVLHHLFPMNFAAATAFMLSCHALSLLVLYCLLQRIRKAPALNAILVTLCGLNIAVFAPFHWWSAGLHRFPLILFGVLSCYAFVVYSQQRRRRFAVAAFVSALLATGFFIKGILLPLYWLAILFCLMDFRDWRRYRGEYALIGAGMLAALIYVVWYMRINPYDTVESKHTLRLITSGVSKGFEITAKMPFQLDSLSAPQPWITGTVLIALALTLGFARASWRPIVAGLACLSANHLMIIGSSRATLFGILVMLTPYYYAELLYVLALFVAFAFVPLSARFASVRWRTGHPVVVTAVMLLAIAGYSGAGWYNFLTSLKPGPNDVHWQSARYIRNLRNAFAGSDPSSLNLLDRPIPRHFRVGTMFPRLLQQSIFLPWFGWQVNFQQPEKPLSFIDDLGNIAPVIAKGSPISLRINDEPATEPTCFSASGLATPQAFTTAHPIALDHGYFRIDYHNTNDASITLELTSETAAPTAVQVSLPANKNQVLIDVARFGQFEPAQIRGVRVTQADSNACLTSITLIRY